MERAPGFSVSPQSLLRGKVERSKRRTRAPARASRMPASAPAGPPPTIATSSIVPAEHQRAVLRSKPQAVAQRRFGIDRAPLIGNEVEIAGGILIVKIDRRRQEPSR